MKKDDFIEIKEEHLKTCEKIIDIKGDCGIPMCFTCPFYPNNMNVLIPVNRSDEDEDDYDGEFYPDVAGCSIAGLNYFDVKEVRYEKCMVALAKQFIEMMEVKHDKSKMH